MTHDMTTPLGPPTFLTLAGSRLYGIDTPTSDYDYVGALVEPPAYRVGLSNHVQDANHQKGFEQHIVKGDGYEGSVYSLHKLVAMLADGNPTMLCVLFSTPIIDQHGICTPEFRKLALSQRSGHRFLAYAKAQRRALLSEKSRHVTRTDLIAAHGFDTKYAAHVIRLGLQGIEFLSTGKVTLPMSDLATDLVVAIRIGKYTLDQVLDMSDRLEAEMEAWCEDPHPSLPPQPDTEGLTRFLVRQYRDAWHHQHHEKLPQKLLDIL